MRKPRRPFGTPSLLLLAALLVAAAPTSAGRDCGAWCTELFSGDVRLTPVSASYEVEILGTVAMGTLIEEFRNDGEEDLEATVKQLRPTGLKVTSQTLDVDGTVKSVSRDELTPEPRGNARQRQQARRAAPPVKPSPVTVEVPAGETVVVRTGFQARLPLSKGLFRLTVPALYADGSQRETLYELGLVPLEVRVRHEEPLAHVDSRTHEIFADYEGDHTRVQLADGLGGRDFELEFAVGPDDDPSLVSYVGREREDGTREVLAVLTPPSKPRSGSARLKEMLFVLDTSGSMAKGKLEQAKLALSATLEKLGGDDMYNIVEFDQKFSLFREQPVVVSEVPVNLAGDWLRKQGAGGGTQLLPALNAAFEQEQSRDRHSMIVIITDGNVQDPREVEQLLQMKLGHARLFVLGIGEDVNPDNIGRFAEYGRGTAVLSREAESLEGVLAELFESISEPLAWDIEIDWGGADVEIVSPSKLPDLYAGRSVTILGRVRGDLPDVIEVQTTTMDGQRVFTTRLPEEEIDRLSDLIPAGRQDGKR